MMKIRWKKHLYHPCIGCVIVSIPVLTLLMVALEYNAFQHLFTKVDWYGVEEYYIVTIRSMCSVVEAIEADSSNIAAFLIPLLAGVAVIPYIQIRDSVLMQGRTRMKHPKRTEYGLMVSSSLIAGCAIYVGFLIAMFVSNIIFKYPVHENGSLNSFEWIWGWTALSVYDHPYLYLLVLCTIRYFLAPCLYAFMTIAISYLTDKIYLYLTLPTIYAAAGMIVFSQGIFVGQWLGRHLSPANFITVLAPLGSGIKAIWFLIIPALPILAISIVCIVIGQRKQMA